MLTRIFALVLLAVAVLDVPSSAAFTVAPRGVSTNTKSLTKLNLFNSDGSDDDKALATKVASATAALVTAFPSVSMAVAEVADDYEYGAVDAPIGIAWVGGVLLILTSFLPIFLKGGEEAFEEMKERDADTFGKRNSNVLNKRR